MTCKIDRLNYRTKEDSRPISLYRIFSHGTLYTALSQAAVFFFQAEDGIRDLIVTGVQTCALPISRGVAESAAKSIPYWSTANGDDTMVTLWNPTDENQDLLYTLFFSGGHYIYPIQDRKSVV